MSMYSEEDFVACLAFTGPPQPIMFTGKHIQKRLRYQDDVETFCANWFKGKPIDGQWAGFLTAFLHWQQNKKENTNGQQTTKD